MPIPELVDGWLPPGEHECTLDEIEARFASDAHSAVRRDIMAAFRVYLGERPLRNAVDHLMVDGSFVSEKPEPGDVDVLVGIIPGRMRMVVANQPGMSPKQVLFTMQGGRTRRGGLQRVHAFPYPIGSSQYEGLRAYFQTSTRPEEPREKGVLHVRLRP